MTLNRGWSHEGERRHRSSAFAGAPGSDAPPSRSAHRLVASPVAATDDLGGRTALVPGGPRLADTRRIRLATWIGVRVCAVEEAVPACALVRSRAARGGIRGGRGIVGDEHARIEGHWARVERHVTAVDRTTRVPERLVRRPASRREQGPHGDEHGPAQTKMDRSHGSPPRVTLQGLESATRRQRYIEPEVDVSCSPPAHGELERVRARVGMT